MGIKAIVRNMERVNTVNAAWAKLVNTFGDGQEFTRKQAREVLKGTGVSFKAINETYNGFKHVRTETFEKTVEPTYLTSYVVYFNDTRFQFSYISDATRFAKAVNKSVVKEDSQEETVECKRFYYVLEDSINCNIDNIKGQAESLIKELQEEQVSLEKQLKQIEAIVKTL